MLTRVFRSPEGALPNLLALGYVLAGFPAGIALLTAGPCWMNLAGIVLTAHTLVAAAYFVHEFAPASRSCAALRLPPEGAQRPRGARWALPRRFGASSRAPHFFRADA